MSPVPARRAPVRPAGAAGLGSGVTDWALAVLAAAAGCGCLAWLGAALACLATGRGRPNGGILDALVALSRPADPGGGWPRPDRMPGPWAYWAGTAAVTGTAAALAAAALRIRHRRGTAGGADRVRSLPGMATAAEAVQAAGRRPLLRRGAAVRPSQGSRAGRADPRQLGYRLGRVRRHELWCSVEDSVLLVGPPRMGKGLHVVIPWVLDAPGPVVATSTRPDTLAVTYHARARRGPVAIFDPNGSPASPTGCDGRRCAAARHPAPRWSAPAAWPPAPAGETGSATRTFGPARPRPRCAACCTPPPSTPGPPSTCTGGRCTRRSPRTPSAS